MNLLLREYLLSGDVAEAEHCLRELEVPHFHHELVYEVRAGVRGIPGRGCGGVLADPCCPQAVVMVLEGSGEGPVTMMVTLLEVLWKTGLVTLDQMNRVRAGWTGRGVGGQHPPGNDTAPGVPPTPQGFQRVYEELGDISLDAPLARELLAQLVQLCFDRGVITRALRDACPARYRSGVGGWGSHPPAPSCSSPPPHPPRRGRKRCVSEGDGGQVKE